MGLNVISVLVAGIFSIAMMATISTQAIVAWCAIGMIAVFFGIQIAKHISSDSSYRFGDNRSVFLLESCGIGLGFIILSNFLFDVAV